MGRPKDSICPECNNPGTLNTHPDCKRTRKARRQREWNASKRASVGTVCQRCASALGFFGHDVERLRAALALVTSEKDYRHTTSERS